MLDNCSCPRALGLPRTWIHVLLIAGWALSGLMAVLPDLEVPALACNVLAANLALCAWVPIRQFGTARRWRAALVAASCVLGALVLLLAWLVPALPGRAIVSPTAAIVCAAVAVLLAWGPLREDAPQP